jgi:protein TonB
VNMEFRARRTPPGRAAGMIGTLVVHAAAAAFLFSQVKAAPVGPPVYAVDLVAAPAPTQRRRLAREAVPTPPPVEKPAPVKPKPTPPPKKPAPPEPKPPPRTEPDREPPPPTAAPMTPAAGETPSTGTDAATIKTPGLAFPFPDYLRNIVNQVYQRWDRSNAGSRSAEISFLILEDGSVRDIRFVTPSGNFSFDLDAQGAIEAAGNSRAFGPLPDGWEADVLPVSLYFKPTR